MAPRYPPQNYDYVLTAGDPTVYALPFLCFRYLCRCRAIPAGAGAPRKLHGPHTCNGSSKHQAEPQTCAGPTCSCPDLELRQGLVVPCPDLELRQGLVVHSCHLPALPITCFTPCGEQGRRGAERATKRSGPCLTLGPNRLRLCQICSSNEKNTNRPRRECLVPPTQIFWSPCRPFVRDRRSALEGRGQRHTSVSISRGTVPYRPAPHGRGATRRARTQRARCHNARPHCAGRVPQRETASRGPGVTTRDRLPRNSLHEARARP